MNLILWTFVITTVGEVTGLIWWMSQMERGESVSAYMGLAAGEAVELTMFIFYLKQTPSRGGGRSLFLVVGIMVLIAAFELLVWAVWYSAISQLGITALTAGILFVLMHLKHDADVANISDTRIGRTWLTLKGFAATGLETLGAMLAIHFVKNEQFLIAAILLLVCITVEHVFGGLIVGEALEGRDFLTPNPLRQEGLQNSLTVVSCIKPDKVEALTFFLRQIGNDVKSEANNFPLTKLILTHFCCWCVAGQKSERPILIFEANFDGPIDKFLDEILGTLEDGLVEIYGHCEGWNDSPSIDEIRSHLITQRVFTNTFYIGAHGLTVEQIQRDQKLRDNIEAFIDKNQSNGLFNSSTPASVIRAQIQEHIKGDLQFRWAEETFPISWNVVKGPLIVKAIYKVAIGIAIGSLIFLFYSILGLFGLTNVPNWALAISLIIISSFVLVGLYILRLRWLEEHDTQPDFLRLEQPDFRIFLRENQQAINHLANVSPIKSGLTRWLTVRAVLFAIHWLARLIYNRGMLAGTSTIHFARWVVINQGKDLLFLSNYDGSWDRYLSDFVDRSSTGLTAIWSNTVEFPKSRWLVLGGAADEEPFKAAARRRQVESLLWYSAYPQLTMNNIQNNEALRRGLFVSLDEAETAIWLRRL